MPSFETGTPLRMSSSPPPTSVVPAGQVTVAWATLKFVVAVIGVAAATAVAAGPVALTTFVNSFGSEQEPVVELLFASPE